MKLDWLVVWYYLTSGVSTNCRIVINAVRSKLERSDSKVMSFKLVKLVHKPMECQSFICLRLGVVIPLMHIRRRMILYPFLSQSMSMSMNWITIGELSACSNGQSGNPTGVSRMYFGKPILWKYLHSIRACHSFLKPALISWQYEGINFYPGKTILLHLSQI